MGGVGKTQLVVEFCYRFGRFFQGVHWIQAPTSKNRDEIHQSINAEIAACGSAMQQPQWPDKLPDQIAFTLSVWGERAPRLVVLDNIEDPEVVQSLLPLLSKAHLILTSRRSKWPAHLGLKNLLLDVLPRIQSIELLCKLAPRLRGRSSNELDVIADRLGDLPLALDLAGRYMEECYDLSPFGYLKELDEASNILEHTSLDWIDDFSPTKHTTSLASTFALSWNRLTEEENDVLSRLIFRACGYCSPNVPIPKQLLTGISGTSDQSIYRALSRLSDLGLIVRTEGGPKLHPLLAEFARRQDRDMEGGGLPILAKTLRNLAVEANRSYLPAKMDPLREHLSHVARFSEDIDPKTAGELWNELGSYLNTVAEYSDAKFANEKAQVLFEKVYGPDHPEVAGTLNNLGRALQKLGDPQEAKKNFERALKIYEKVYGPDHINLSRTLTNLGIILCAQGKRREGKRYLDRALLICKNSLCNDHPITKKTKFTLLTASTTRKGSRIAFDIFMQ